MQGLPFPPPPHIAKAADTECITLVHASGIRCSSTSHYCLADRLFLLLFGIVWGGPAACFCSCLHTRRPPHRRTPHRCPTRRSTTVPVWWTRANASEGESFSAPVFTFRPTFAYGWTDVGTNTGRNGEAAFYRSGAARGGRKTRVGSCIATTTSTSSTPSLLAPFGETTK